eukprot:356177-Chlamydomonas_euryale.AAC.1
MAHASNKSVFLEAVQPVVQTWASLKIHRASAASACALKRQLHGRDVLAHTTRHGLYNNNNNNNNNSNSNNNNNNNNNNNVVVKGIYLWHICQTMRTDMHGYRRPLCQMRRCSCTTDYCIVVDEGAPLSDTILEPPRWMQLSKKSGLCAYSAGGEWFAGWPIF